MTPDPGTLAASAAMAAAAGMVGSFALMRRMTLAADAISHVALPGIGIALALRIHPLFGAAAMLFFGALLVWALERRTRLAAETVIGVVFSTALAVGSFMSSGEELIDALFGGPGHAGPGEVVFGISAAAAVVAFVLARKDRLVLALVSPEIARTSGIDTARLELFFLETFALTVALGLRYLGVLLMGSLIIVPAATARRLSNGLAAMLGTAVAVAVISTIAGSVAAGAVGRPTGPVIVAAAAALFLASLFRRRS